MITIAGGIILAILILFFTALFLPKIISTVQTIFSWILVVGAVTTVCYFLVYSLEETLVFLSIVGVILLIVFFYFSKKVKKSKEENLEKEQLIKSNAIETEKKVNLIEQLEIKLEISKIKHDIGYLLLDSEEDVNKNRKKIINIGDYQILLIFSFSDKKFDLRYKKMINNFFSDLNEQEIKELSINDIFNLNNEIKIFNNKQKQIEINKAINSKILDKSFFEDVKQIKKSTNENIIIFIYQHLVTEDGIYAYKPTQCIDKIIANVREDLGYLLMNVSIDFENVARIEISKWNQMRQEGKIEFSSEVNK